MRQHNAIAVADDASIRDDRDDGDPVGLGQRLIVLVLDDLQIEKPSEEPDHAHRHERAGDRQPPAKQEQLALRILELGRAERAAIAAVALAGEKQEPRHLLSEPNEG